MFGYLNKRIKYFTLFDVKLTQMTAMCVLIILIKFIPQITSLNTWWYVAGAIIFALRPLYLVFIKK